VPLLCGSCQTPLCPLTLALISASTSSQLAAAIVVILMPHAAPKATGVEGQAPSKEELNPLKGFQKPWKAVQPASPSASMLGWAAQVSDISGGGANSAAHARGDFIEIPSVFCRENESLSLTTSRGSTIRTLVLTG
jgi:hypothetical protein